MKLRMFATLAIAPLVLIGLAACTSTPAPVPSPVITSAAAHCTPSTAKFQWSTPDASNPEPWVPARVTVLDYTGHNGPGVFTTDSDYIAPSALVQYDPGNQKLQNTLGTGSSTWKTAIIASLRLSGQVPDNFGTKGSFGPASNSRHSIHGKFLVVDEERLASVPFTILCSGSPKIFGTVVGAVPNAYETTQVRCGEKAGAHADSEVKRAVALEQQYCGVTTS